MNNRFRARFWSWAWILLAALVAAPGCAPDEADEEEQSLAAEELMTIEVRSTAFNEGQWIPKEHTGAGSDTSPPLAWTNVPTETKELAVICDDPDARGDEPWVHWVIYKIPASEKGLPENVSKSAKLKKPAGALQGKNSWQSGRTIGYRGPMPPPGERAHRYQFTVYALSEELEAAPELDRAALLKLMEGKVLAKGRLTGTYQR